MFTGIIETTAPVLERTHARLSVARPASFDDLRIGSSVAVNGVCLTVVDLEGNACVFDVVGETWRRTNLGELLVGNIVNMERALAASARFEGHMVQGHVEGVATVNVWKEDGPWKQLLIDVPPSLLSFIVEKGSIALDGVSLTVAAVQGATVTVALIPYTLAHTTLGLRAAGERINVETDILAHYVLQRSHGDE